MNYHPTRKNVEIVASTIHHHALVKRRFLGMLRGVGVSRISPNNASTLLTTRRSSFPTDTPQSLTVVMFDPKAILDISVPQWNATGRDTMR